WGEEFSCNTRPPVADLLDQWGAFRARFRESCVFHRGRDLKRKHHLVDNFPAHARLTSRGSLQVPVASWFDYMADTELLDLLLLLKGTQQSGRVL
uniref:Uncharacterized protein n=1 Tax=Chelonoidis abingdonii TaxID=106734 RepID=A0A8C0GQP3_CHEAB